MRVLRKCLLCIFSTFAFISILFLAGMISKEEFDTIKPLPEDESFCISKKEQNPRDELTSFIITKDSIILYYDAAGLVNVYSIEGEFQYGIQIELIDNGKGNIGVGNDKLYIESRGGRIYVFVGMDCEDSFRRREYPERYTYIARFLNQEKGHSDGIATYYYQKEVSQIQRKDAQGNITAVISLPQKNDNIKTVAMVFLLSVAAIAHFLHGDNCKFGNRRTDGFHKNI